MNQEPFVVKFRTENNYYIYDVNSNRILLVCQSAPLMGHPWSGDVGHSYAGGVCQNDRVYRALRGSSTVFEKVTRPCFAKCSDRVRRNGPPVSALRSPPSECGVRITTRSQRARLAQRRAPPFFAAAGDNCCRGWSACECGGSGGPERHWPADHCQRLQPTPRRRDCW